MLKKMPVDLELANLRLAPPFIRRENGDRIVEGSAVGSSGRVRKTGTVYSLILAPDAEFLATTLTMRFISKTLIQNTLNTIKEYTVAVFRHARILLSGIHKYRDIEKHGSPHGGELQSKRSHPGVSRG